MIRVCNMPAKVAKNHKISNVFPLFIALFQYFS